MNHHKKFVNLLAEIDNTCRTSDIMDDFLEMAVVAIANPFYKSQTLEDSYLGIVKKYSPKKINKFCELLAIVVAALEDNPCQDFLGTIYEEIGSNEHLGQFFTPYTVSQLIAESMVGNPEQTIADKGYITVIDPACGAGSLLIAFRNVMCGRGYGSDSIFVTAIDIDRTCFNMAYIQLSLLGIAGEIILGNSLSEEYKIRLCTPATFLIPQFWHLPYTSTSTVQSPTVPTVPTVPTDNQRLDQPKVCSKTSPTQLSLFDL